MKKFLKSTLVALSLVQGALIADSYWWSPTQVSNVSGFVDRYQVAANSSGKFAAIFDDRVFGVSDLGSNQWSLYELTQGSSGYQISQISSYTPSSFSSEYYSKSKAVELSDEGSGVGVFRVSTGVDQGKIGLVNFKQSSWMEFTSVSTESGVCPTVARVGHDKYLVIWINDDKNSEHYRCLFSRVISSGVLEEQKMISKAKSAEMTYHQTAPIFVSNSSGDGALIWKSEEDQKGSLYFSVYDGIEEKWTSAEKFGSQSMDKKSFSASLNDQGDLCVVWEEEDKIQYGNINLVHHLIKSTVESFDSYSDWLQFGSWRIGTLAEGEDLSYAKVQMQSSGVALAVWSNAYNGASFAYKAFDETNWHQGGSFFSKATYSLSLQKMGPNHLGALMISEGDALDEVIYGRIFNCQNRTWSEIQSVCVEKNSLIDTVDIFSIASNQTGLVMWFDFFKEKLFYSTLRNQMEPQPCIEDHSSKESRKNNRLYLKKQKMVEKRKYRSKK